MQNSNQIFAEFCKISTPINRLIGAARSAESIRKHSVTEQWVDGILEATEEAALAMDGLFALIKELIEEKRHAE